ncbi:threonine/serine dehydratase [Roseomonas xinghualingensis]|uniref:threonine/serine dehydratase n=1 Tax=Roseomonas xinghualingensis TaxID=2986475 RepID=UPI0021F1ACF9|nr:threonine/serine dehydratase [Roseomonas sp. SXEYE001]MCV4208847.1 threonine/serine dehydratase [Roseomonas sp. SXEYE001]
MTTRSEIEAAAARIAPHIRHTPVLALPAATLGTLGNIVLKLEQLQVSGSFKARGAFNALLQSNAGTAGVIAASGGNHGAAVAHAAGALGIQAEIYVPAISTPSKVARIREAGAVVVQGGATYAEAFAASESRRAETGAISIHAYDQPEVLAGQGTLAREFEDDFPDLTHVLVAVGGGGLIGGVASWFAETGIQVVAVEPEGCPTLHSALKAGAPVDAPVGGLAADSLGARRVGSLMFEVAREAIRTSVLVTDDAIREAQRRLWSACRQVTEPGGATALAALTSGAWMPPEGARVGVVVCGGNCEPGSVAG